MTSTQVKKETVLIRIIVSKHEDGFDIRLTVDGKLYVNDFAGTEKEKDRAVANAKELAFDLTCKTLHGAECSIDFF